MKRIKLFLTCLLLLFTAALYAQNIQVKGTVTDVSSGEPIPFASIQVKGTMVGTATDDYGKYSISVPANGVLIFSSVGYLNVETQVMNRTVINAALSVDAIALEDVILVAYGSTKKESFTGSAEVLKSESLKKRTVSNVTKAVEGLATGIQVTSGSGQPGSGSSIVIRGFGSINASSQPLYVVDGIPFDGAISSINPNDIESMTILKDASAGALYGARGANGVVMINTKRGGVEGEKMTINFKSIVGVSNRAIQNYETLNVKEWMEYNFLAYKNYEIFNNGVAPSLAGAAAIVAMASGPSKIYGQNELYNPYNYKLAELFDLTTGMIRNDAQLKWSDNWLDEVTAKAPLRQEYNLSVTGSTKNSRYMASIGYLEEEGTLQTTNFNRFSARTNVDVKPVEWFKYGINMNFSQTLSNYLSATGSATSNVFYSCFLMSPIYPIWEVDADGKRILDAKGQKKFDYGLGRGAGAQQNYNSIATLYEDKFSLLNDNVSARAFAELLNLDHGPIKGLKLSSTFGFDYINQTQKAYSNPYFGNAAGSSGRAYRYLSRTLSFTFNQLLSYNRSFGSHNVDFLAGHEFYAYKSAFVGAGKSGFPFGGLYELDAAATTLYASSYEDNYSIESYLSRLNYNYADKYYLSASFRRDGSSRFAPASRWGNFWSVGANWRISQEDFVKGLTWLNNLNVKASYGVQGNDAVGGFYPWQALYDLSLPNAGRNGAYVSSLQNEDLVWEKNGNLNIGIDARIFKRFSFAVEYYNRKTTDMLMNFPIALSAGFTGYDKNIGSMQNTGFETTIAADILTNENARWSLTLMGSTVKNKVLNLADKPEIASGNYIIKVGETLNSFYLPVGAGVDPTTGKLLYKVWDKDADGNITKTYITTDMVKASKCREIAGSRIPILYGSINNTFTFFKNIDLSVLCTYSIGGKMLDGVYTTLLDPLYEGNTLSKHLLRAWKKPGDITDIPMPMLGSDTQTTNHNLIDASYFSIKNVTLGYSLPQKWIQKVGLRNVRLSAIADNIMLFSYLKGMDPQYNFTGGTDYVYTPTRSISLGLDITF